jgi:hypothetical protein
VRLELAGHGGSVLDVKSRLQTQCPDNSGRVFTKPA